MGIQMALFGGQGKSQITAQTSVVSSIRISTGSISFGFLDTGRQVEIKNGNISVIGDWVNPPNKATDWEVRAVLDSGDTPSGPLGSWLAFNVSREWGFTTNSPGTFSCTLTFEFRRVGDTLAEFTVTNNTLSLDVVDPF